MLVCALFLRNSCHRTGHAGYLVVTRISGAGAGGPGTELKWGPGPQAGVAFGALTIDLYGRNF